MRRFKSSGEEWRDHMTAKLIMLQAARLVPCHPILGVLVPVFSSSLSGLEGRLKAYGERSRWSRPPRSRELRRKPAVLRERSATLLPPINDVRREAEDLLKRSLTARRVPKRWRRKRAPTLPSDCNAAPRKPKPRSPQPKPKPSQKFGQGSRLSVDAAARFDPRTELKPQTKHVFFKDGVSQISGTFN